MVASLGIYVVESDAGRAVVIAINADVAAEVAQLGSAGEHLRVGRLGTYDPGIEGSRLAQEQGPVLVFEAYPLDVHRPELAPTNARW